MLLRARLFGGDAFAKNNSSPLQTGVLPATGVVNAVPFVTFLPGADDPDSTRAGRFLNGSADSRRTAAGEAELFAVVSDAGIEQALRRRAGGHWVSAVWQSALACMTGGFRR